MNSNSTAIIAAPYCVAFTGDSAETPRSSAPEPHLVCNSTGRRLEVHP